MNIAKSPTIAGRKTGKRKNYRQIVNGINHMYEVLTRPLRESEHNGFQMFIDPHDHDGMVLRHYPAEMRE